MPGEPWRVAVNLKKAEAKIPGVPKKLDLATEILRGAELRLNERYDEKGNWARDSIPRDIVDIWCARAGVVFATQALLGACAVKLRPGLQLPGRPYGMRRDGQPWGRLREHLAAASESDRAAAKVHAAKARTRTDELRAAVAYAFCDPTWVAEDLEGMFKEGYGRLALLTALPDAKAARAALLRLLGEAGINERIPAYQLFEEAPPHIPNLVQQLDDSDADLIHKAQAKAFSAKVRKLWDDLAASLVSAAPAQT